MSPKPLVLLDGGMASAPTLLLAALTRLQGTTLEALGADVSSPLWGCQLVHSDPAAISAVHRGFLDAGADIVETATYQMTVELLCAEGHSVEQARAIMRSAVHLAAAEAEGKNKAVALSIGPLGATLKPGQEYAGRYPPPHGPNLPSPSTFHSSADVPTPSSITPILPTIDTNSFASPEDEKAAENSLTLFHLERLRVFAQDEATWRAISWIAFETVPLIREIRAIRTAMKLLRSELDRPHGGAEGYRKRFWITSAYPGGEHGTRSLDGEAVPTATVAQALLDPMSDGDTPDGIGINCTNPAYLSRLVTELTDAAAFIHPPLTDTVTTGRPFFVLYPDGGNIYDVVARQWSEGKMAPDDWAAGIAAQVRQLNGDETWGGIIVGGCCKAGFAEIQALRKALDETP